MSTRPYENNFFVYYIPAIADATLATVTAAEITAGTDLTPGLIANGVQWNMTQNTVSTPMLTGFIRQNVGTEGAAATLQFIYDPDTVDLAAIYDLFATRGLNGFLWISQEEPTTTGVAGEVYPGSFGRRKRVASAQDTDQQFTVMFACNADYNDAAATTA